MMQLLLAILKVEASNAFAILINIARIYSRLTCMKQYLHHHDLVLKNNKKPLIKEHKCFFKMSF